MSPDISSPTYPDRPIRPLPKRRLRERLSPDVADNIRYPSTPKNDGVPLFYSPYSAGDVGAASGLVEAQHPSERERADEIERNYIARRNGVDADSDEEEIAYRSRIYSRHSPDTSGRSYRYVQKQDASRYPRANGPASTTSSADGYDSFENTNNKKKRKIPTPGDSGMNVSHMSGDLVNVGVSAADDLVGHDGLENGTGQYYGSGGQAVPSAQGFSGPGRGRYGRVRSGRSPLRTLSDASSNWSNGRAVKQRQPLWPATSKHISAMEELCSFEYSVDQCLIGESTGIISTAIANAGRIPVVPSNGQENVSLLQRAAQKTSPASAQFTFTCDSQVPAAVTWPDPHSSAMQQIPATRGVRTHATQTSPSFNAGNDQQQGPPSQNPTNSKEDIKKKTRRRPGKEYLIAARQRRQEQEYQNYHHPPSPEDRWMCEFCEYESIFGHPPEALMRQYEIKDRRARRKEAEKRRLLEKAKMKGRKGKKGTKSAPKNGAAVKQGNQVHPPPQGSQGMSQGTQSEEYYEDEYEGEYAQDAPPPPTQEEFAVPRPLAGVQSEQRKVQAVEGVDDGDPGR